MLREYTQIIKANDAENIALNASYIRIESADIKFKFQTENGDEFTLGAGDEVSLKEFIRLKIINNTGNDEALTFYHGINERVGSAKVNGSVIVESIKNSGQPVQSQKTLTNENQVILAANANRKYLIIQNNGTAGVMRVTFDGTAASATKGFRLIAGASQDFSSYQSEYAVNAFMETASVEVNNIEILEG